jgi:hypothetical protein
MEAVKSIFPDLGSVGEKMHIQRNSRLAGAKSWEYKPKSPQPAPVASSSTDAILEKKVKGF